MVLGIYGASGLGAEFLSLAEKIDRERAEWERWTDIVFIDDDAQKLERDLLNGT